MYKVRTAPQPRTVAMPKTAEIQEQPKAEEKKKDINMYNNNDAIKTKVAELRQKTEAKVRERIILVGVATEPGNDNPYGKPNREARLYMFVPDTVGDITKDIPYDQIMWDKAHYRLEVYDYREDAVNRFCERAKTPPYAEPGHVNTLATAYEFDANGQHTDGYGQMELITMPILKDQSQENPLLKPIAQEAARRGEFHFSLKNAMYTDAHAHLGDGNTQPVPVFALSIRGPYSKHSKNYAVIQSNKLCHVDTSTNTYFRPSDPLDFSSLIKAIKDKTHKK